MRDSRTRRGALLTLSAEMGTLVAAACGGQPCLSEPARLSVAAGLTGGVYYLYGQCLARVIGQNVKDVTATAVITPGSVDNLKLLGERKADLAFTLADTLDEASKGQGPFRDPGSVPAKALAVLYSNYTHVVTLAKNTDLNRIADLKGKVVSTGAPGSGTEVIADRLLRAARLDPASDIRRRALQLEPSVQALKDGSIDAFFWSGGLPTAAVLDLANTPGLRLKLLPSDELLRPLQILYGRHLYYLVGIPSRAYPGLAANVPVVGVANLLVVHEKMAPGLACAITRALFDRQADLVQCHPEAANLTLASAIVGSPVPFHPGAVRYYRERNVWNGR